jgi:hypothetical protein
VIVMRSKGKDLARLRDVQVFDRACAAVPSLAVWTDGGRAVRRRPNRDERVALLGQ